MFWGVITEVLLFLFLTLIIYFVAVDGDPFWTFLGNAAIIVLVIIFDEVEARWLTYLVLQHWFGRLPRFIRKTVRNYRNMPRLTTALYLFYALIIVAAQVSIHYPDIIIWMPTLNTGVVEINRGHFSELQSFLFATQSSLLLLVALHKTSDAIAWEIRRRQTTN